MNLKSHFRFNKLERSGIFFLLFILIGIQIAYFLYDTDKVSKRQFFEFDVLTQQKIDSLKATLVEKEAVKLYPFNPNFITDYKGYALGMSVEEIDRLHKFREANKFVNSKEEFQKVTHVSDSLLDFMAPYFKFPDWTKEKTNNRTKIKKVGHVSNAIVKSKKDLNTVSADELKTISGIGEKLSARIVKFRDRLGGFLVAEQLYDVYGLDREVADKALEFFTIIKKPAIIKINVNEASVSELSKLVYLQKGVSQRIINYRNHKGSIDSLDELLIIEGFPTERFDRIALYLSL